MYGMGIGKLVKNFCYGLSPYMRRRAADAALFEQGGRSYGVGVFWVGVFGWGFLVIMF